MTIKIERRTREDIIFGKNCIVDLSKLNYFEREQISFELAKRGIFDFDPNVVFLYVTCIKSCAILNGCLFITCNVAVCLK